MNYNPMKLLFVRYLPNSNEIQNKNWECVKETATQPKSRKQPKYNNGFSKQQENPAP